MAPNNILSRRKACSWQLESASHAGLWFDRGIEQIPSTGSKEKDTDQPFTKHAKAVATISEPAIYAAFIDRWKLQLAQHGATTTTAETLGRLALGLGGANVIEAGLRLQHTYGMPIIPGSALKGLAANFADCRIEDPQWRNGGSAHTTLFGTTDQSGCVTFFDALYVPSSGYQRRALHTDIVTVHHPKYYQGKDAPPADWDSPTPISFLSITGKFLIALAGPEEWVKAAFAILKLALEHEGIGAKTNAGYGRMALELPKPPPPNPADLELRRLITDTEQLQIRDVAGQIRNNHYKRWKDHSAGSTELRKHAAQAILEKIAQAGRTKKEQTQTWFEELRAFVKEQ
jgi:CRISPR-associated protein Cmr6